MITGKCGYKTDVMLSSLSFPFAYTRTGYNSSGRQHIHDSILPETAGDGSRPGLALSHKISQWYAELPSCRAH